MRNSLAHRRRAPGAGFVKTAFWDACSQVCQSALSWGYRFRVEGAHHVPRNGPVIFIANHQSFLDPMIHGLAVGDRAPRPMAKQELFRNPLCAAVLRALNCIPVRSDGGNRDAVRSALEELAAGRTIMVYPEGSRSPDGSVKDFRRGVELLARKSGAPIVPMGIDGAFDVWPSSRKLPFWSGRIWASIGAPISPSECSGLLADPELGLKELRARVIALMRECRARLRARSGGKYPAQGVADERA